LENDFYVSEEVWAQVCYAITQSENCLITGPSGCGKTELCSRAAEAAGRQIEPFNCGAMSEPRSTLIGNVHFNRDRGTWFSESRFVQAIQQPNMGIKLDEIGRLQPDGFNILLPLLDGQAYLALDEQEAGAIVHVAEGVFFTATANVGRAYTGSAELDKALKDRFGAVIDLTFPPPAKELALLKRRHPDLSDAAARRLVDVAARQRQMAADGEFEELISTRVLLHASAQIEAGIALEQAVTFCILNHFSDEGGEVSERAKLAQIVQKGAS
jgi:MoxR-like ATPase